jgi:DNA repair photolyase
MKIIQKTCKTALSPSRLPGIDYSLNPYRGCSHQCSYCYVPNILHIKKTDWQKQIHVKTNIPTILSKELKRKKPGIVGISTVTDPYQPVEQQYHLTRYCLEQLFIYDFPISIQTKSSQIINDLQLITQFTQSEVMISIATNNDHQRKLLEPHASTLTERLKILQLFADSGIKTSVFLGPIYPTLTQQQIPEFIKQLADHGVKEVMVDQFHLKPGIWRNITKNLTSEPMIQQQFKTTLFTDNNYYITILKTIETSCKQFQIDFKHAFPLKKK